MEVQVPQKNSGLVRRLLASSNAQYQEGKVGVGAAWEATSEGGRGADSLGKVLPSGSAVVTLVWIRYMGANRVNEPEDRGSACEFIDIGHTKSGNMEEGRVLPAGAGRRSAAGSGYIGAKDICSEDTVKSGGVGVHPAYVFAQETGFKGGGRLGVPWWKQKAVEDQMRGTVEAMLEAARVRRRQESGRCDGSEGGSEGGITDIEE